jgi:hypothetical protein
MSLVFIKVNPITSKNSTTINSMQISTMTSKVNGTEIVMNNREILHVTQTVEEIIDLIQGKRIGRDVALGEARFRGDACGKNLV